MVANKKTTLSKKLTKSSLIIVLIGVSIFVLSVFTLSMISERIEYLSEESIPIIQSSHKIQSGLKMVNSKLTEYINSKGDLNKVKREEVWKKTIWPEEEKILFLYEKRGDEISIRNVKVIFHALKKLEIWHEKIEEMSFSNENYPANNIYTKKVMPVYDDFYQVIYEIMALEKEKKSIQTLVVQHYSDLRANFLKCNVLINEYLTYKDSVIEDELIIYIDKLEKIIQKFHKPSFVFTDRELVLIENIKEIFSVFKIYVTEMIEIRKGEGWNKSKYWLNHKAIPIAQNIDIQLEQLIESEKKLMENNISDVTKIYLYSPMGMFVLLILMVLVAFLISRYYSKQFLEPILDLTKGFKTLKEGNFANNIEITSNDELEELVNEFNEMNQVIHHSQEELKTSELKSRSTIDTAVDAIITINHQGIIQDLNPSTEKLFQYRKEELLNKNVKVLIPDNHKAHHDQYIRNYLNSGNAKIIGIGREVDAIRKDGVLFPIHLSISEYKIEGQSFFTGTVRDLTEIKKIEAEQIKATRELEEKNLLKIQQAELSECMRGNKDVSELSQNILVKVSEMCEVMRGAFFVINNENVFGIKSTYAYVEEIKDDKKQFRLGEGLVGQAALEMKPITIKEIPSGYISIESGLGNELPKYIQIIPILYDNKTIAVFELATFKELTEKQNEFIESSQENIGIAISSAIAIERTNELLEQTKEQATELLKQKEVLQKTNKTVEEYNTRLIENENTLLSQRNELHTANEELQEQTLELKIREEELEAQQEKLRQTNVELEKQKDEIDLKNKDLQKAELEMRNKAKELETASKYKSEFLANMSHELRTPLNSLLILSKVLQENRQENLDEREINYAKTIYESGSDLLKLINDILDLSKVEAGKIEIHVEEITLQEVKSSLEKNFDPMAKIKNVEFKVEVSKNCPERVYFDKLRLEQILRNLISNALKFTAEGYVKVRFDTKNVENQLMLEVNVEDTGIGIPKDKQKQIFEAFQQADGSTSRNYGGTGLGLSITKELVHLLEGDVNLVSEENKGSQFKVSFPLNKYEASKKSLNESQKMEKKSFNREKETGVDVIKKGPQSIKIKDSDLKIFKGKKILVADDEIRNIYALISALEPLGVEILPAKNGLVCLEELNNNPDISLILMDIMMPEMDGFEAIKRIRESEKKSDVPIVAVTALAMKGDAERCIRTGANAYVSKPIDIDLLVSEMKTCLSFKVKQV